MSENSRQSNTLHDTHATDTQITKDRILDAAESCFGQYGIVRTRVRDIAHSAGYSRATVYRYFDNREGIITSVLLREAQRFGEELKKTLHRYHDIEEIIVEGIVSAVDKLRVDTNFSRYLDIGNPGFSGKLGKLSTSVTDGLTEFITPVLEQAQESGHLPAKLSFADAKEWLLRTLLSLLSVNGPTTRNSEEIRHYIRTFIVPVFATPTLS